MLRASPRPKISSKSNPPESIDIGLNSIGNSGGAGVISASLVLQVRHVSLTQPVA